MDAIVEYKSNAGLYIVRLGEDQYYYGNGGSINGFGVSPVQFLRFNPYLEYVGEKNEKPPEQIQKWIEDHVSEHEVMPDVLRKQSPERSQPDNGRPTPGSGDHRRHG